MSKPVNITQGVGPHYYSSLLMENTVNATATKADNDDFVAPSSVVKDYNNKIVANKYSTGGNFYFISSHGRPQLNYLQVVSEGALSFYTKMSIDGVNWATGTPTGISGTCGTGSTASPANTLLSFGQTPVGTHYRITTTVTSGDYYINILY